MSSVETEDDKWRVVVFPEVLVACRLSVKDGLRTGQSTHLRLAADQISQEIVGRCEWLKDAILTTVPAVSMSRDGVVWTDGMTVGGFQRVASVNAALLIFEEQAACELTRLAVFQSIGMIALRCHLFHEVTSQIF